MENFGKVWVVILALLLCIWGMLFMGFCISPKADFGHVVVFFLLIFILGVVITLFFKAIFGWSVKTSDKRFFLGLLASLYLALAIASPMSKIFF